MEQITIRFHGERADEIKELYFDWLAGQRDTDNLSFEYWLELKHGIEVKLEIDGDKIHVREG